MIVERLPTNALPGINHLSLDAASGGVREFYSLSGSAENPIIPTGTSPHNQSQASELVKLLAAQNPTQTLALAMLAEGASAIVTGQQVGLFGGPLFTPMKAATAIARARKETTPHVPIFWLASEERKEEARQN